MKGAIITVAVLTLAAEAFAVPAPQVDDASTRTFGEGGLIPSTTDFSYLRKGLGRRRKSAGATPVPSRWDSREHGWVTRVGNQSPYGTCWAFATAACLETADLKASNGSVTNDFSENHLATHAVGFETDFSSGGNNQLATALLTAWRDPLREEDDPYPNPKSDVRLPPCRHVQDVVWLPRRSCPTWSGGTYVTDPVADNVEVDEEYKRAVMEYGAAAICYYHCNGNYDSSHSAHYLSVTNRVKSSTEGGHAVTLIGWDDDYPASGFKSGLRPPGNGAFLCKNSWGGSGELWISYYDEQLFCELGAAYPQAEAQDNFGRIYQYDPCGQTRAWNCYDTEEEELIGGKENWCANVFTAVATGEVAAVGFYSMEKGTEYTVRIVRGCGADPSEGDTVVEQTGTVSRAGFVTVRLDEAVPLTAIGERFAVALHLECPTYGYPLAVEGTYGGFCTCTAYEGESFMSKDGKVWKDFQEYDRSGNFCVKAYTAYAPGDVERYEPTTLYVDAAAAEAGQDGSEDHPFVEIQSALNAAIEGDGIEVAPGVYHGLVNRIEGVTVRSTDGAGSTFIDGGGTTRCLLDLASAELVGFTLRNGRSEDGDGGGGALRGVLYNCVITDCVSDFGGGAAETELYNCLIVSNRASMCGGGVCDVRACNCTIADNRAGSRGGGVFMYDYAEGGGEAVNCIVAFNSANGYESGDDIYDKNFCVTRCFSDEDPGFADRGRGDYRLCEDSPCVDAGYDDCCRSAYGDLDGNPRVSGAAVDLGCYEYVRKAGFAGSGLDVSAVGQTIVVSVVGDGTWTLDSDAEWLVPEVLSGEGPADIAVTVGANGSGGARRAELTLSDEDGGSAELVVSQIAGMPRGGRRYGLFVGVDRYDRSFIGESDWLSGCRLDATNLLARCVGGRLWRPENVTLMSDSQVTKAAVRGWLQDMAETAEAGDVVLYCHSGHGDSEMYDQRRAYLCLYSERYYDSELAEDLARFRSGVRVVVYADACRSGGLFKLAGVGGGSEPWDFGARVMASLPSGRRRKSSRSSGEIAFITAADFDQDSWAADDECSDFTAAFTAGWASGAADADGDGILNFRELFDYAAERAKGLGHADVGERTEAQCSNEPLLLGLMAEVKDPQWPDPGVESGDSPSVEAAKVAAALAERGYTGSVTSSVTSVAQYQELARWTEETGVSPARQSEASTPLVSAALGAEGLLDLDAEDVRLVGLERSGAGWAVRIGLEECRPDRVNRALLAAAVGVVGSATPDGGFTSDGLETALGAGDGFVEATVTGPADADVFFFRGTVR